MSGVYHQATGNTMGFLCLAQDNVSKLGSLVEHLGFYYRHAGILS